MSDKKPSKTQVKARLPKGMRDVEAQELRALTHMLGTISEVYERYGFEPLDTPAFEYTDALGKFLPDTDRPNEGVFSFQDEDEQWVSMRYDLTAPLARYVAQNFDATPKPFRRYQTGYVYRNEKPGPGRFRQFMQFDADTVGTANPAADAEMCMLAADTLEALGLKDQYIIKVNSRKVLDGVLDAIGLSGEENAGRRLQVLRAFDKYDRLDETGVRALLGVGRKDESGDFTAGAGLGDEQINKIFRFYFLTLGGFPVVTQSATEVELKGRVTDMGGIRFASSNRNTLETWSYLFEQEGISTDGVDELARIIELCEVSGFTPAQIRVDGSVIRGLEYYTGPVFEAELTFPATDESGQAVRFGSVGGGGRYDGLVSRFRSQPVPATGFSIGVSRLYAALSHLGKIGAAKAAGPVVVLVMDKTRVGDYQRMAKQLRDAGIRAEMYVGEAGMKAQMKYADKRGSPCVIIQGEDERAKGEVTIKDLLEGSRLSGEISDHAEWKEARPAQFSVSEGDLVAAVQKLLAEQVKA
ncbi:histidine--tRNA ligase [Rhodomicrobium vannielii ATCC 17100]|uniref:histidine--tRNA ligase n=1 Tax=Rhodomicrobium vannielii TaxID=1069 RepID=UPI0019189B67|nr:histidine--tRNA ligase [Rhodomicrobium vannielii]MBJ7535191.1 histidine--tRNA ligase [Rhodomicrobium vannielii ATCC 17100]